MVLKCYQKKKGKKMIWNGRWIILSAVTREERWALVPFLLTTGDKKSHVSKVFFLIADKFAQADSVNFYSSTIQLQECCTDISCRNVFEVILIVITQLTGKQKLLSGQKRNRSQKITFQSKDTEFVWQKTYVSAWSHTCLMRTHSNKQNL